MKYVIVQSPDMQRMTAEVERYLAGGWRCQGGVSVCNTPTIGRNDDGQYYTYDYNHHYSHAMILQSDLFTETVAGNGG